MIKSVLTAAAKGDTKALADVLEVQGQELISKADADETSELLLAKARSEDEGRSILVWLNLANLAPVYATQLKQAKATR